MKYFWKTIPKVLTRQCTTLLKQSILHFEKSNFLLHSKKFYVKSQKISVFYYRPIDCGQWFIFQINIIKYFLVFRYLVTTEKILNNLWGRLILILYLKVKIKKNTLHFLWMYINDASNNHYNLHLKYFFRDSVLKLFSTV